MTTVVPSAAATTATPPASTTTTDARPTAAATTISAAVSTSIAATRTLAASSLRRAFAIEVGLIRIIRKIAPTLNDQRTCWYRLTTLDRRSSRRSLAATHLRALFFQNRFARKPDAIALHRQHFHQHLIAFFQLVAHIGNPMFRH